VALGTDQTDSSTFPLLTHSDIERVNCSTAFQIVFAGDSGVGKTSFIHKLCTKRDFMSTFSSTVGVDFLMKTIVVNRHIATLQLWDTAGQERFRSMTRQYFRKADGVIIMYDVTSESTFRNVHIWLDYIQDGISDGTVLVLVGNKQDLTEGSTVRAVSEQGGALLAKEVGALFAETSAKSGSGIEQIIEEMTSMLLLREMTSSLGEPDVINLFRPITAHKRPTAACCAGLSIVHKSTVRPTNITG
jgi:Ras and EF-hand domain-containing protein